MDLKQIEKLISAIEKSQIKRLVLKQEGFEIELEKESAAAPLLAPSSPHVVTAAPRMHEEAKERPKIPEPPSATSGQFVTSPMVGTFYLTPSPDDPPFVKVGDSVKEDSVLCIIEAMKVMNEIKAGTRGKIVEILLKNGSPVEFGTKIFRIDVS